MKALVTGGAGFIGSHVVDLLIKSGYVVSVIDNLVSGKISNINPKATFYEIDICSNEIREAFKEEVPDLIFHLAAQSSLTKALQDPVYDEAVNVNGTLRLLEMAREFGVKKIIYSSSAAIYGNPVFLPITEEHPSKPVSQYGLSKWLAEHYIKLYNRMYNINYAILRYSNVYGPRQTADGEAGVITIFIDRIKQRKPVIVNGDGTNTRDFIYVNDVAKANLAAAQKGHCTVSNIATGKETSLLQLIKYLEKMCRCPVRVEYGAEREGDIARSSLAPLSARYVFGWEAKVPLIEGLTRTLEAEIS